MTQPEAKAVPIKAIFGYDVVNGKWVAIQVDDTGRVKTTFQ